MIRCIAIDDEPLALKQLEKYIGRIPDLHLVAAELSPDAVLPMIKNGEVDLLFLDIEMPDMSGIEFMASLGEKAPYVIFTTAYSQYAVDGFRLDAVDYLLKPLSFNDMQEAVERVRRRIRLSSNASEDDVLWVRTNGKLRPVKVPDILYIKGLGEYVQIKIKDEPRMVVILESMHRMEDRLRTSGFMRIHRSYIVNLHHISETTRSQVKIADEIIPVGEKYRVAFSDYLRSRQ